MFRFYLRNNLAGTVRKNEFIVACLAQQVALYLNILIIHWTLQDLRNSCLANPRRTRVLRINRHGKGHRNHGRG